MYIHIYIYIYTYLYIYMYSLPSLSSPPSYTYSPIHVQAYRRARGCYVTYVGWQWFVGSLNKYFSFAKEQFRLEYLSYWNTFYRKTFYCSSRTPEPMTHVIPVNESRHTHEWDASQSWMSHVTYERVMSHIWTSHVTHMNESCHTHERVMSHTWTSHVTHIIESCHTHEWAT